MRKPSLSIFTLILFGLLLNACATKDSSSLAKQHAEKLLKQMTLEEKVGQMAQITLDVIAKGGDRYTSAEPLEINSSELKKAVVDYHVGSILNTTNNRARRPEVWNRIISEIQQTAMKDTRLGVPVIYGIDAIHGVTYTDGATMLPQEITLAATFNPSFAKKAGEITAYETRASGIPWNFSPVLDLGADPRFPRQFEGFGEDPYLGSVMGSEMVKGYEGTSLKDSTKVASCIKHFLGYSVPISGKDRTPAYIPEHILREYHLPAFKKAIESGARTIMINSGIINGVSVHADYQLLTKLLKQELGFKGVVITDWADIENLYRRDRVAANMKEAIEKAINAGIDMSMIPYQYEEFCTGLVELVKEGKVKEDRINDAVLKILTLKYELNLFNKPVTNLVDYPDFGSDKFAKTSYNAASEAITLLKNKDNILPLSKGKKILVCGPNANSMRPLNGGWSYSWQGEKTDEFTEHFNTIYETVAKKYGEVNVTFIPGVSYSKAIEYYKENKDQFNEVLSAAKAADVILLCLGENSYTEKPGDLNDMYISDLQTELALEVAKAGKPVILVLNEGRPRVISKIEPLVNAVIQTYLPSNFGGDALADVLAGNVNPSGKLPYTYPKSPNTLLNYYHKPAESQKKMEGAYNYEGDFTPQYEFGYGLSYTTFEYSNIFISKKVFSKDDDLTISVDVKNAGKIEGKEVVMLYTSDLVANMTPDAKRLRRFEKISLAPGETKTVVFSLPAKDLAYVNQSGKWTIEPGEFEIAIGNLKQKISLVK